MIQFYTLGTCTSSDVDTSSHTSTQVASSQADGIVVHQSGPCTYIVGGDNVDFTIDPRDMRSDNQRKSIHFFHVYAALDRVNCIDLPDNEPCGDIKTLSLSTFVPSSAECNTLRMNYATLLSRIVVEKLEYFKAFQCCVVKHIQHENSDVMKQKSLLVSYTNVHDVCMYIILFGTTSTTHASSHTCHTCEQRHYSTIPIHYVTC